MAQHPKLRFERLSQIRSKAGVGLDYQKNTTQPMPSQVFDSFVQLGAVSVAIA
jgi:hypothetical protein